jgi:hypothetical protein
MPEWLLAIVIAVSSIALYLGLLRLMSVLGPWQRLAAQFPLENHALGATRYWPVSLKAGLASYGNCLIVEADADWLTLIPMFIVRPFHPPITLPRSAVSQIHIDRFWFVRWVSFVVDDRPLQLYGRVVTSDFWNEPNLNPLT